MTGKMSSPSHKWLRHGLETEAQLTSSPLPELRTKPTYTGLPPQCLEVVGKLGPTYRTQPNATTWAGASTSVIPYPWKSGQFHTRCKRPEGSYGQFHLTLYALQRNCLQSKADAVYDKAVVRGTIRDRVCSLYNTFGSAPS